MDTETNGGRVEEKEYKIIEIGAYIFENEMYMNSLGLIIKMRLGRVQSHFLYLGKLLLIRKDRDKIF